MSQHITKGLSGHSPHLFPSFTMKAISSADEAKLISLCLSSHSIRKVESITGLGNERLVEYSSNWKWTRRTIKRQAIQALSS